MRLLLMLGTPLLLMVVSEVGLRLAGVGYPTAFFVPATIQGRDVKIENDRFTWRFMGRQMARQPFPVALPTPKPPGTIRIFVLGESAAYGDPQPEFGLARMLEALLEGRYPGKTFEVVNVAMTAINSQVLVPLARDCAKESGDAWVIYMGNNEVVGPFGAGTVFGSPGASQALIQADLAIKGLRCGQVLDGLVSALRHPSGARREWGGMAMFLSHPVRSDDPSMKVVYAHFERNLREMLSLGQRYGVKLAVGTVASNLKDCAPFASLHRAGLGGNQLAEWDRTYQKGLAAWQAGRPAEACDSFQQAGRIDDSYADLQFAWGQCSRALGRQSESLQHLTRARDEDVLRFRADSRLNEIIRNSASGREAEGIGFVDTAQTLATQSPQGLTGDEFLYEHVHLNFEGNYRLARAFAQELARLLPALAEPPASTSAGWPSAADCAKRLGFTDWHRYEAQAEVLSRIADAPYTGQLTHREEYEKARAELAQLRPAADTTGLRQARDACRDALAQHPHDWVLNKNLALVCDRLGDSAPAAESWQNVVAAVPQYAEAWQQLARCFAEQKQDDQAQAAFERAAQLDSESPIALTGLAEIASRHNRTSEALDYYRRILKFKPYWGPAQWGMGQILESLGRTNEAEPHFRQALQNRIYTPAALKGLGTLCFGKGWLSEAATNFSDALRLDPVDAPTQVNLGLTLALLGRHQEAQACYAEALRLDPNLAEAHVRLGFELGRQHQDGAALEHFAKAVELRPDLVEARLDLGIALLNQHRETEATEQFRQVLQRSPGNSVALRYLQKLQPGL